MFGCVDAEQGEAAGQHRPGGFGEGEPGTVGGRGFLVAERQDGGQQGRERVGDGDEVPGQPVGGAVVGGGGEDAGVVGERVEEGVHVCADGAGVGGEAEVGGVTEEGAGTGVGVPDAEEGVGLALGEVLVVLAAAEVGAVVRGGVEEGPAGGVAAEGVGSAGAGTGRRGSLPDRTWMSSGTPRMRTQASSGGRAQCSWGRAPWDRRTRATESMRTRARTSGAAWSSIVCPARALLCPYRGGAEDVAHEAGVGAAGEGDVEEPGSGDDDVADAVGVEEAGAQHLGDGGGGLPCRAGELEGDVGGVVAAATGPGGATTTRSGTTATASSPSSTARRTACSTVRESSTGVTGQA